MWGSSDGSRERAYSVVVSQVGGSIPGLGKRLKGRNVDRQIGARIKKNCRGIRQEEGRKR